MSRVSDAVENLVDAMVADSGPGGVLGPGGPLGPNTRLSPGGQTKGGGSQHWNTPRWIVHKATEVLGSVDLDPFSNAGSITRASVQWYGPCVDGHDGFVESWAAVAKTVLYNPPWNRTGDAVRKAAKEARDGCEIIGIIPCSMNSRHWPIVERAAARCYLHKRPSFLVGGVEKRGNPKDVCIYYAGQRHYRFADVFHDVGRIHFGGIGQ